MSEDPIIVAVFSKCASAAVQLDITTFAGPVWSSIAVSASISENCPKVRMKMSWLCSNFPIASDAVPVFEILVFLFVFCFLCVFGF